MPITVTIRADKPGASEPSLTFDGSRIVIGRSDGSDVRLPDPSVSSRHVSLRAEGAAYSIVDEGSTNGTWVGGVKLPPHTSRLVKSGDLVRLGRVWIELTIGQRAATADLALATRDIALAMVRVAMAAHGDDTRVKVRVVEGADAGRVVVLVEENRMYTIGRGEGSDLDLADEDASRTHASVIRRGNQVFVTDLRSSNGVQLGEQRLTPERETAWRSPTMMRIGQSVLTLDEPVSSMLGDLANLPDEKLPTDDEPPPPPPPPSSVAGPPTPPPMSVPPPAPIAEVPKKASDPRNEITVRKRARKTWTLVDILVVGVAIAIIGASIAGLIWVLK